MFKLEVLVSDVANETVDCVVFIMMYVHSLIFMFIDSETYLLSIMCAGEAL